jgi:hypothetical protein
VFGSTAITIRGIDRKIDETGGALNIQNTLFSLQISQPVTYVRAQTDTRAVQAHLKNVIDS